MSVRNTLARTRRLVGTYMTELFCRFERVSYIEEQAAGQSNKRKARPQASETVLKKVSAKGDEDHRSFAEQTARHHQLASETFQRYDTERAGYLDYKRAAMAMLDLQIQLTEEDVRLIVAQYEEENTHGPVAEENMPHDEQPKGTITKEKVRACLMYHRVSAGRTHAMYDDAVFVGGNFADAPSTENCAFKRRAMGCTG